MTPPIDPVYLAQLMYANGWRYGSGLDIGIAVAWAESGLIPDIDGPPNSDGSVDRGIWQINNKAHPTVTDAQAHDPVFATEYARKLYVETGNSWGHWAAFTNNAFRKYMEHARLARRVLYAELALEDVLGRVTSYFDPGL